MWQVKWELIPACPPLRHSAEAVVGAVEVGVRDRQHTAFQVLTRILSTGASADLTFARVSALVVTSDVNGTVTPKVCLQHFGQNIVWLLIETHADAVSAVGLRAHVSQHTFGRHLPFHASDMLMGGACMSTPSAFPE